MEVKSVMTQIQSVETDAKMIVLKLKPITYVLEALPQQQIPVLYEPLASSQTASSRQPCEWKFVEMARKWESKNEMTVILLTEMDEKETVHLLSQTMYALEDPFHLKILVHCEQLGINKMTQ